MAREKKEKQYERKRRKYTFTLSDEAYKFLKNNVTNASRFVERLIEEAEKGIRGAYVTIAPIGVSPSRGLNTGPADYKSADEEKPQEPLIDEPAPLQEKRGTPGSPAPRVMIGRGRYRFTYAHVQEYFDVALKGKSAHHIRSAKSHLLKFLQEIELESIQKDGEAKNAKIFGISAILTYPALLQYNKYANTLKSGTPVNNVRAFLKYFSNRDADEILKGYAESLTYVSPKEKSLFAKEGGKAAITFEDVESDIALYYEAIKSPDKQIATKKALYRNIVSLLFGITTGYRVEEISRITTTMINTGITNGYFEMPAKLTKTKANRVCPIHPAIIPFLELLKKVSPDNPFNSEKFRKFRPTVGAQISFNQTRNFAVKYWRNYGLDEKLRAAIMGHDEGVVAKAIAQDERMAVSEIYGKYTPDEIAKAYHQTVGENFNPIPAGLDLPTLESILTAPPKYGNRSKQNKEYYPKQKAKRQAAAKQKQQKK